MDKGYISGLFDGEGCIVINKRTRDITLQKDNPRIEYTLSIMIGIINKDVLANLATIFGGTVTKRHNGKNFPVYSWTITNNLRAKNFIETVLPYSRIKKSQLLLALEFIECCKRQKIELKSKSPYRNHKQLSQEQYEERERYRIRMQQLKREI